MSKSPKQLRYRFQDIKGHHLEEYIINLDSSGNIFDTNSAAFSPNTVISRGE